MRNLVTFLHRKARQWVDANINGPVTQALTGTCRRHLAEDPFRHTVLHDVAAAAVEKAAGGHRRLMAEITRATKKSRPPRHEGIRRDQEESSLSHRAHVFAPRRSRSNAGTAVTVVSGRRDHRAVTLREA